jgi:hypothetical protein
MRSTLLDLAIVVWVFLGYLSAYSWLTAGHVANLTYGEQCFLCIMAALAIHINIKVNLEDSKVWHLSHLLRIVNLFISAISIAFGYFLLPILLLMCFSDESRHFALPGAIFLGILMTPALEQRVRKIKKD